MRDIKFRGKRIDSGEWVYGFVIKAGEQIYIADVDDKYKVRYLSSMFADVRSWAVDPSTVGQFTGLKDKAGREVYEGDIVRCRDGVEYQGVSEYDARLVIEYGWTKSMWELMQVNGSIEVVGNIHTEK